VNSGPLSFTERLEQIRAAKGKPTKAEKPEIRHTHAQEDIPDVLPERSTEEDDIDKIISDLDPIEAYRRWIGKEVAEREVGKQEVHISCPFPNHRDEHPSAWILTKPKPGKPVGTWYCGGCDDGGDLYDLAAIRHSFQIPGYKDGKTFHELRQKMAEDFGYTVKKVAGGTVVYKDEEQDSTTPASSPTSTTSNSSNSGNSAPQESQDETDEDSSVVEMWADDNEPEVYPTIRWKEIATHGTFLEEYMKGTCVDDSPEEYHFWHAMLALGHAVGRKINLDDTRPVYGNMLVCLLGATGVGKSRSREWLDDVIEQVCPFKDNGLDTSGVKITAVPGSGEALVKMFSHQSVDPSLPKGFKAYSPVNGIVDYDEFAALVARANRQGSTLKTVIMAMADCRKRVATTAITTGEQYAESPFCSVTASTQPKAIRSLLHKSDADSGFLNRWLFVGGAPKKRIAIGGQRLPYQVDLSGAIAELKGIRAWGAKSRTVTWNEDAAVSFTKFFDDIVLPVMTADESALLKRLDLTMKRICLLLAINERSEYVTVEMVKKAKILFPYLVECYGLLDAEIGISQLTEITNEILRHLKRHEEKTRRGASARDLQRYTARKKYPPDMIKKAIDTMVALDWIEIEKPTAKVGRPTIRYRAVS
jgi:hypothetical protein